MCQNKRGIFNHSHSIVGVGQHNHLDSASISQIDEFKFTLSNFIRDYVQESVNRGRAALFPMPMEPIVCIHRSKHGSRPDTQKCKAIQTHEPHNTLNARSLLPIPEPLSRRLSFQLVPSMPHSLHLPIQMVLVRRVVRLVPRGPSHGLLRWGMHVGSMRRRWMVVMRPCSPEAEGEVINCEAANYY